MIHTFLKLLLSGILVSAIGIQGLFAQTLSVTGEVKTPLSLTSSDFQSLERTEVTAKDRDGKEHRYAGVTLTSVLRKAGVTLGGELRGENLSKYIIAKAGDGYEVLFSLAEVDAEFSGRTILVADSVDGAPLPQGVGPFRLVIPDEKRPARWIRELKSIEIRFAK